MSPDDETPADEGQPERRGTSLRRFTVLGLLSLFGLSVLALLLSVGIVAQVLSYLWPTVYYTEITADVTAEGQRYQLTSMAKCTLRSKARFFGLVGGSTPATIDGGLLVKRLPSGAGLMIIGPAICEKNGLSLITERETNGEEGDLRTVDLETYLKFWNSRGGQPFVYLSDNAEEPTRITGYWKEYLMRPNSDLQIHSIRYRLKEPGWLEWPDMPEPEKELPWLEGRRLTDHHGRRLCESNPIDWKGFYVDVIEERGWSQYEAFDYLRDIETISVVNLGEEKHILNIGSDLYREWVRRYEVEVDPNGMSILLSVLDLSFEGTVVYYPNSAFAVLPAYEHQFFFLRDSEATKNNQKWMYDPDRMILFQLHTTPFGKHRLCR